MYGIKMFFIDLFNYIIETVLMILIVVVPILVLVLFLIFISLNME